jgi:hypothetical protein
MIKLADILKEILSANKDAESGILNVYSGGLLKVGFTNNDKSLKVTYFLVRKQE